MRNRRVIFTGAAINTISGQISPEFNNCPEMKCTTVCVRETFDDGTFFTRKS
jgi:hypothetical protein